MLHRISTPILLGVIFYHTFQYYRQWQMESIVEKYRTEKQASKPRVDHSSEDVKLKQQIVKVSDNVYVAVGYALGNSIMLIGRTGIVVVDTTESIDAAKAINQEFRKITDKPLLGVIYTHNHADHVLGTESFLGNNSHKDVEIWAHHTLMHIYTHSTNTLGEAHYYRAMHQFGGRLSGEQASSVGFKARLSLSKSTRVVIPPNKLLYTNEQDISIAEINIRLLHVPGETDDHIAVFLPDEKVLLCGDDFYMAFPNLYAIRGTGFRSLKKWYESLDIMRNLQANVLISSHTLPVHGTEKVYNTLTNYRDAVQLVHDQTVRFINQGLHPDEIAERIHLPKALKDKHYLRELYGTVKWSSKGLFSGYMGWFSGDIVELNPHTPSEQANRLVKLAGGIDNLLAKAQESLGDNDPQWALRLSSAALRYDSTNQNAKEIKIKSLFEIAATQTSMNGYNYYVTCAYTTMGKIEVKVDENLKKNGIRRTKMKDLFFKISLRVKAEECSTIDKVVLFVFPDTQQNIMFHLRNGIMDLSGQYSRNEDIKVTINSVAWREILTGERSGLLSAVTSDLVVEPGLTSLQEIMKCVDRK